MNVLIFLIPIALLMGLAGLGAFLWSLSSGQFDDLDGAAWRVLDDDADTPAVTAQERQEESFRGR